MKKLRNNHKCKSENKKPKTELLKKKKKNHRRTTNCEPKNEKLKK